eukprot:5463446-Prymnesium_polylepis.1
MSAWSRRPPRTNHTNHTNHSSGLIAHSCVEQAAASPGAVVHDSPHPYPDNADIRETFSIPG